MKSIRLKVWVGMMVLVIIVLILLWFSQVVFLERYYMDIKTDEIKRKAYDILQGLYEEESSNIEEGLDQLSYNENLSLELFNANEDLIYSSGETGHGRGHMHGMGNNARNQTLKQVLSGNEIMTPMTHMRFGNRFMLIGLPVTNQGEVYGALLIDMPIEPVEATVSILKNQLIIITITLLAISIIISSVISQTLTRPIRDITKGVKDMAAGDFSIRIKTKSRDEIGMLGETFNFMGEELGRIDELRKELIGNVSHDLRTPLSLIRGYAETLRDITGSDPDKRQRQLNVIIQESNRLNRMVDDVLNLSQMQSGYITLSIYKFNVANVLRRIEKRFKIMEEEKDIDLKVEVQSNIWAMGDEVKLKQVLYNLVDNAFNHTRREDKIFMLAYEKENTVRIEVKDTGSGIPENQLDHIWDRYYKVTRDNNARDRGHGLGLSIVKSILEAHQVPFGVESKEGVGTTFWFEINKSF